RSSTLLVAFPASPEHGGPVSNSAARNAASYLAATCDASKALKGTSSQGRSLHIRPARHHTRNQTCRRRCVDNTYATSQIQHNCFQGDCCPRTGGLFDAFDIASCRWRRVSLSATLHPPRCSAIFLAVGSSSRCLEYVML